MSEEPSHVVVIESYTRAQSQFHNTREAIALLHYKAVACAKVTNLCIRIGPRQEGNSDMNRM